MRGTRTVRVVVDVTDQLVRIIRSRNDIYTSPIMRRNIFGNVKTASALKVWTCTRDIIDRGSLYYVRMIIFIPTLCALHIDTIHVLVQVIYILCSMFD